MRPVPTRIGPDTITVRLLVRVGTGYPGALPLALRWESARPPAASGRCEPDTDETLRAGSHGPDVRERIGNDNPLVIGERED
ncbi:hypothetical protein MANY_39230 [Mycolicibacterium anyangense]|uniref:Uncharacterized protein n=1 Tax=Mycolicibacterium anyangense TaxID=1431246 RepID=A0A6N4W9E5_9MYCO|nr:hypothetical protein MANY_39230 [Mycolicibacterium anyangense]